MLPGTLEWWHVIVSILGIVLTFSMRAFGNAFKQWADKLEAFQATINSRLGHMEQEFATRMTHMESKFNNHEERVHKLTLHVERRVTWIEARLGVPDERRWPLSSLMSEDEGRGG